MRKLILILFILTATPSYAQEWKPDFFTGKYTLIRFDFHSPTYRPVLVDVITDKDSINVDLTDFNAFAQSVLASCEFIPLSDIPYQVCLYRLFGLFDDAIWIGFRNSNRIFGQLHVLQSKTEVELLTGEIVHVSYYDITGLFIHVGKDMVARASTTAGLLDKDMPDHMAIPIAIINYERPTKKLVFY